MYIYKYTQYIFNGDLTHIFYTGMIICNMTHGLTE